MSNSALLRRTQTANGGGRRTNNKRSVSLERKIKNLKDYILDDLRKRYPTLPFFHTSTLPKQQINGKLKKLHHTFGAYQSCKRSFIKPDGGLFWVELNGTKELILVMEAKQQGTNNVRLKEGLRKQSKGNALERSCKNFKELADFLWDKPHFPFLIMVSGDDLKEGSSIRDRITSLTSGSPPNHYYTAKVQTEAGPWPRASLFMRNKAWSSAEILEHALAVATESVDLLLKHSSQAANGRSNLRSRRIRVPQPAVTHLHW